MMSHDPSHGPQSRSGSTSRDAAGVHGSLRNEILREAARNRGLHQALEDIAIERDFGVVSPARALEIAHHFSIRLSLLREALVIIEGRLEHTESSAGLHALHEDLTEDIRLLPSRISEVREPIHILRALHGEPDARVAPEFVSAILGIHDERVGGDVDRFSGPQLKTEYANGGFMYQPSEIVDIWPIFEHLTFAPGARFYDLGSGYGHSLFYGAALRPDLFFTGIEIMSARVEECRSVASRLGLRNITFAAGDVSKGGFTDADIIFLFNPFPPDTEGEVRSKIAELAGVKPIVVLDYQGLVTQGISTLRPIPFVTVAPYRLTVSRGFYEQSCALAGIPHGGGK